MDKTYTPSQYIINTVAHSLCTMFTNVDTIKNNPAIGTLAPVKQARCMNQYYYVEYVLVIVLHYSTYVHLAT